MAVSNRSIPDEQLYRSPVARVYTSPELVAGDGWTARPHVHVEVLALRAGPDVDEAQLSREFGDFTTREKDLFGIGPTSGPTQPLADLDRHFVKIEVLTGDPQGDPENVEVLFTWYGRIEADEEQLRTGGAADIQTGRQTLRAYGLLRMLETVLITESRIETATLDPQTIGRGLGFNTSSSLQFNRRGNRSEAKTGEYNGYVFSVYPAAQVAESDSEEWDAEQALRYLLEYHAPVDEDEQPIGDWQLLGELDALTWYDVSVETDRRTVKAVIDDLVDRRRLLGYHVFAEEEDDTVSVFLRIFTFSDTDIPLPGGGTLAQNPNQVLLKADTSRIVDELRLGRISTHVADAVIVEGERITSTCTLKYGDLEDGWTSSAQQAYELAANGDAEENTRVRAEDKFDDVFARFVLKSDWDQKVTRVSDGAKFLVVLPVNFPTRAEDIPETIDDADVAALFAGEEQDGGPWWHQGATVLRHTLLKLAGSQDFRPPFVLLEDHDAADLFYYCEKCNSEESERAFACHLQLLPDRIGIRLRVNRPGGQQLLARGHFAATASDTPEALDPADPENKAFSFEALLLTCSLPWDDHVAVRQETAAQGQAQQPRTLVIRVPDARLDFELPGTVTGLDAANALVESTGKVLRDDRPRLRKIAAAAAEWYGRTRRAVVLAWNDLVVVKDDDEETPVLNAIGELVMAVGDATDAVRTPITGLTYDFRRQRTTLTTDYAAADFGSSRG